MKRFVWVDERLAWAPVLAVVFLSLSLIAVDYSWRLVEMTIEQLMLYAFIADAVAAALLIAMYRVIRARHWHNWE